MRPLAAPLPAANPWLGVALRNIERRLAELLATREDEGQDPRWWHALVHVRSFALRPAKRLRPLLLLIGHGLASGENVAPEGVVQFAAALELLHTFVLIHDDIADQATLRRGGATLHRSLAPGTLGENLAVVAGDYLFARSLEAMLGSAQPGAVASTRYQLGICRETAAGQFLDLDLSRTALRDVTLFQTLRVAHLKTARYGFVAPLVSGAMLAGGPPALLEALERVGRHAGLAYQLRDDLLGLFGDPSVAGKSGASDFSQRKRTFPVVAAYARAPQAGRRALARLWERPCGEENPSEIAKARRLIRTHGGEDASIEMIARSTRAARRALSGLPVGKGAREVLDQLLGSLGARTT